MISTLTMRGFVEKLWKFYHRNHDGAPPHWQREVINYSMQVFHSAGLAAQQATTCHLHVGHPEVRSNTL
jgi:hypothetical protein